MTRMLIAPDLTYADQLMLAAAGSHRPTVAAALWTELPGVLDAITANPKHIARVPATWVPQVVACLDTNIARGAVAVDSRKCTLRAWNQLHGPAEEAVSPPTSLNERAIDELAPMPMRDLVALIEHLATTAEINDADIDEVARHLWRVSLAGGLVLNAIRVLWQRPDWTNTAQRIALARSFPPVVATALLCDAPRWTKAERFLLCQLLDRSPSADEATWQVAEIAETIPVMDTTDPAALAAEATEFNVSPNSLAWSLVLAAAGIAPDFTALSRHLWAEHTGLALVWLAHARGAQVAYDAHQAFLLSARIHNTLVEKPSSLSRMRWVFTQLAGHDDLRVSLSMHCFTHQSLGLWFSLATAGEMEKWQAARGSIRPFNAAELGELIAVGDEALTDLASRLLHTTPGLVSQLRGGLPTSVAERLIATLGAAFGGDPQRWRTALEIADEAATLDQILTAVNVVHG